VSNAVTELAIGCALLVAALLHIILWPKVDRILNRVLFPKWSDRWDELSDTGNWISFGVAAAFAILFLVLGIQDLR
jgi:hypothetical protein